MKFIGPAAFVLLIGSCVPVAACTPPKSTSEQAASEQTAYSEALAAVESDLEEAAARFAQGRYEDAVVTLSQALSVSETELGEGPFTALVLTNLGLNQASSGRISDAEGSYLRALAITDRLRSLNIKRDLRGELDLLNNLSLLYLNTARPEQARPYVTRARTLLGSADLSDQPAAKMIEDSERQLERAR